MKAGTTNGTEGKSGQFLTISSGWIQNEVGFITFIRNKKQPIARAGNMDPLVDRGGKIKLFRCRTCVGEINGVGSVRAGKENGFLGGVVVGIIGSIEVCLSEIRGRDQGIPGGRYALELAERFDWET